MANSFYPHQPRPSLPPVPPQLKHHPSTGHRPPLPPVPSDYRAQAVAEQQRQHHYEVPAPYALTADNLRQIDYFNSPAPAHPPHPPQPIRSQSTAPPRSSPIPAHSSYAGAYPTTAPLARAHSHQNQSHPHSAGQLFLEPSPRLTNFPSHSNYAPPQPAYNVRSEPTSPGILSHSKPISLPVIDLDMLTALYEQHFRQSSDPVGQVQWASKVFKFIERSQGLEASSAPPSPSPQDPKSAQTSKISDPLLVKYTDIALKTVLKYADGNPHLANGGAEALYLRGDLYSTGAFPSYRAKDPMLAFRDFEAAAHLGYYLAWFRIGREYENCEDWDRAIGAYEHGLAFEECACVYRLGMSYLLGQMNLPVDMAQAVVFLKKAAQLANEETPQPAYIYGMILAGEFESLPQIPHEILPPNLSESRYMIEKAAYLGFAAAQYKIGWCYEYSQITCPFDPLLSVEYYSLASQQGESEADMALSKWFLCGADGHFAANEPLAVTFAEKAARKGLGSAMFAIGYYLEVGIAGRQDAKAALEWYQRAWQDGGNEDARERLASLGQGGHLLSRQQHEQHLDQKLVRKHTMAASRSPAEPPRSSPGVRRRETMRKVEEARRVAEIGVLGSRQSSSSDSPPSNPVSVPTTPGSPYSPTRNGHHSKDNNTHAPRNGHSPANLRQPSTPPHHHHHHPSNQNSRPLIHKHSTGHMVNRLNSFQLSDDGPIPNPLSASKEIDHITTSTPAKTGPKTQFNSFADMGIQTAKAKKTEECTIV
ncbi:hypothetical protein PGT21_036007 [Puccinia graminis f. sp. tritici]|uniref:Uncharacterized protein n=1 Tax=Puccinia graminis f. sp. tritici TaxID=56615 RepID=A0A5B0P373_PUCGR|nr:hypothetical protein PGT21_036007 [Puccinia graminis f. sp. tritici]KAA1121407.1 hypothetical protein PGTUg99_022371 [Puccinia graminis f. sp. tritici]